MSRSLSWRYKVVKKAKKVDEMAVALKYGYVLKLGILKKFNAEVKHGTR